IFEARPRDKGRYGLRELITGREVVAVIPSGYNNSHAALMLTRLAPPLNGVDGYHVSITTPYMLLGTTEQDWTDYFRRQQIAPPRARNDFTASSKQFLQGLCVRLNWPLQLTRYRLCRCREVTYGPLPGSQNRGS